MSRRRDLVDTRAGWFDAIDRTVTSPVGVTREEVADGQRHAEAEMHRLQNECEQLSAELWPWQRWGADVAALRQHKRRPLQLDNDELER